MSTILHQVSDISKIVNHFPQDMMLKRLIDGVCVVIFNNLKFLFYFIYRVQKLFLCKDDEDQSPMKFYFGHYISCRDPKTKEPAMKV